MHRRSRSFRAPLVLVTLAGAFAFQATSDIAHATFPGKNGDIIAGIGSRVSAVDPATGKAKSFTKKPSFGGSISADGQRLVYWSKDGLFSRDVDSGGATQLTVAKDEIFDGSPTWLGPSGSRIAFTTTRNGEGGTTHGNSSIFTVTAAGTDLRMLSRLHHEKAYDESPASSPDGSQIAFERVVRDRSWSELFTMPTDASDAPERITYTGRGFAYNPSFSPDGKNILFRLIRRRHNMLATVPVHGGRLRILTKANDEFFAGVFSPDGKRIAAARETKGGFALVVMNANGKDQRTILARPWGLDVTDWAPR